MHMESGCIEMHLHDVMHGCMRSDHVLVLVFLQKLCSQLSIYVIHQCSLTMTLPWQITFCQMVRTWAQVSHKIAPTQLQW